MKELFQSLGFLRNPFSTFSAEEELTYLNDIFNPPKYFSTLYSDLSSGSTRFIFGERGSGKSALMYKLITDLNKSNVFTFLIDNFDDLPLTDNSKQFIIRILRKIITHFSISLLASKQITKKLTKSEKEKLSFYISIFFKTLSKSEFEDLQNKVTKYKSKNFFKYVYNKILSGPLNVVLSSSIEILSDTIARSIGLPIYSDKTIYKAYLPQFELIKFKDNNININDLEYGTLKNFLSDIVLLIKKVGFKSTVIFFDKIDEFRLLEGNVQKIVNFIKAILQDTSLLQISNLSLVFVIWNRIRIELNSEGVRFDKFKPIDVTWDYADLKKILILRVMYFSKFKIKNINKLITNKSLYSEIINLSNKSPRDLLRLLSFIYDQQSVLNGLTP